MSPQKKNTEQNPQMLYGTPTKSCPVFPNTQHSLHRKTVKASGHSRNCVHERFQQLHPRSGAEGVFASSNTTPKVKWKH